MWKGNPGKIILVRMFLYSFVLQNFFLNKFKQYVIYDKGEISTIVVTHPIWRYNNNR